MCWKKLKLPKRWLLIKHYEKKTSIKKWKMLYFKQTQESSLFSNNIIWLVCRMVTIFLPTQRTRHLNKVFSSKHEFLSEYFDLTLSLIFQNLNFFRFSWHIIWWMCRAFTICLLTQRTRLSGPSRYLRCVRKAYGKAISPQKAAYNSKILRNDWKSVSKQKSFTQGWDWFRVEVSNCK